MVHDLRMASLGSQPPSRPRRPWGVVASFLSFIAAGATFAGAFAPLFVLESTGRTGRETRTLTGWGLSGMPTPGAAPINGVPLTVAAVALLVAGVAGIVAAAQWSTIKSRRTGATLAWVGAAFAAGAVATVATQVAAWSTLYDDVTPSVFNAAMDLQSSPGYGLWLLIAAVAVALAAALVASRNVKATVAPRAEPVGGPGTIGPP